jgi:hypothetical protein
MRERKRGENKWREMNRKPVTDDIQTARNGVNEVWCAFVCVCVCLCGVCVCLCLCMCVKQRKEREKER